MRRHALDILLVSLLLLWLAPFVSAQAGLPAASTAQAGDINELKSKISEQNQKIETLEKEIEQYEKDLEEVNREKQSLENAIQTLDISRNKLATDIRVTENRVYATNLQIEEIDIKIGKIQEKINANRDTISALIRKMDEIESASLVEIVLVHNSLNEFSDQIEVLRRLQANMQTEVLELRELKKELEGQRRQSERKKTELNSYRADLVGQKRAVDINRTEKDRLLTITENEEGNYQKLIEEKKRLREEFEQELFEFESQLRFVIDPSRIPPVGSGVLTWPLDDVLITQYFGNTNFATKNPQVYSGKGHNGIDLRASVGTPVRSALSGTVEGAGDTDIVCPYASYGKWILIRHNNGLSTLYAHLSAISVKEGSTVSTGSIIGHSGNTGYSTGPHLHFSAFATQGVQIRELKSRVCSGTYILPLADFKAYLNPLSYL